MRRPTVPASPALRGCATSAPRWVTATLARNSRSVPPPAIVSTPAGQQCVYTLTTTTNLGTQGPDANDYTGSYYCDPTTGSSANCPISGSQYRTYNLGTSFAAPQVSGIGALM